MQVRIHGNRGLELPAPDGRCHFVKCVQGVRIVELPHQIVRRVNDPTGGAPRSCAQSSAVVAGIARGGVAGSDGRSIVASSLAITWSLRRSSRTHPRTIARRFGDNASSPCRWLEPRDSIHSRSMEVKAGGAGAAAGSGAAGGGATGAAAIAGSTGAAAGATSAAAGTGRGRAGRPDTLSKIPARAAARACGGAGAGASTGPARGPGRQPRPRRRPAQRRPLVVVVEREG